MTASIADSDYLAAARVIGVRRRRVLRKYVLPNAAEPLLLQAGVGASLALISISALSFLGLGVQSPNYDWGRMLNDGLPAIYTTPSAALAPGVAITIAGLTFNLFGEALARAFNPRLGVAPGRPRRVQQPSLEVVDGERRRPAMVRASNPSTPLVVVDNLRVSFEIGDEAREAVSGVSFELAAGEIVGLVGESGSGKSMTALALAGLAPFTSTVEADRIEFDGRDLRSLSAGERRRLLATDLAVVFQDPMSSLNPSLRVGRQLTEKVEIHRGMSRPDAYELAETRLRETHIPAAGRRLAQYPFEFSGGMRQRAMIAMGLMTDPALIIADEPTTALDVTVQAQVLKLFREINARKGTTILLITHDLAVISEICSRVMVMYSGRIIESLPVDQLRQASHPYTRALLGAVIDLETNRDHPLATIPGHPPTLAAERHGCPFAPRCSEVMNRCHVQDPGLQHVGGDHVVACWARSSDRGRAGSGVA
jgi:oligopeptide/dipeptide ABC transporter ATP-binding protein